MRIIGGDPDQQADRLSDTPHVQWLRGELMPEEEEGSLEDYHGGWGYPDWSLVADSDW